MSSSMFIEPSVQLSEDGQQAAADANLVVVYGKTGVNIDPKDLEKLIEEKTVQSISVIRLTSPTPSMKDAEEAERLEAEKNAQDSTGDDDEQSDNEANEKKSNFANTDVNDKTDTEAEDGGGGDTDASLNAADEEQTRDEDSSDHDASALTKRKKRGRRKKIENKCKPKKSSEHSKPRAELVGLNFEGFYEAEAALEIAKQACKLAGISYVRNTAEHEAMVLVINNDHCYTPFTSPEQMKAKLTADKLEAEKIAASARKIQPLHAAAQAKQQAILMKARKPQQTLATATTGAGASGANPVVTKTILINKPSDSGILQARSRLAAEKNQLAQQTNSAEESDEDESTYELIDIDTDETSSEQTAESENDRDSDLDFDVNKPQMKKPKKLLSQKRAKRLALAVAISKQNAIEKRNEERHVATSAATSSSPNIKRPNSMAVKSRVAIGNIGISHRQIRVAPPQTNKVLDDTLQRIPGSNVALASHSAMVNSFQKPSITVIPKLQRLPQTAAESAAAASSSIEAPKRNVHIVKSDVALQSSKQNVKEIVLNKVMSSPKGGFTELSTLFSTEDTTCHQPKPIEPAHSKAAANFISNVVPAAATPAPSLSRGFMRIDTSTKNQLPAQISIETHHTSNELAAEHDKQLDLIDSIVKDELNKSLEQEINDNPAASIAINENIPKLVEMLESTEKALESNIQIIESNQNAQHVALNATGEHPVDEIDISHGLPEDLLQHVVELIEDDKTLQAAVEQQIMEEQSFRSGVVNQQQLTIPQHEQKTHSVPAAGSVTNAVGYATLPAELNQAPNVLHVGHPSPTSKSIIQMSISNVSSSPAGISAQYSPASNVMKSSPMVRRDPIQIVRGNGRVITLPPIEAPTTRAKRRAQVAPSPTMSAGQEQPLDQAMSFSESSLDNSMHSNASFSVALPPAASLLEETAFDDTLTEKNKRESLSRRRASKEEKTTPKASTKKINVNATLPQSDADTMKSQDEDDDDPNKLWCICRQPHNNRFMICCDSCSDWFHGKCVNITKAMGREMEQKGKEWTCPLCKKKQEDKQQRKLTDMLQVKQRDQMPKVENIARTLSSDLSSIATTSPSNPTTIAKKGDEVVKASIVKKEKKPLAMIAKTPSLPAKKAESFSKIEESQKKLPTISKNVVPNRTKLPGMPTVSAGGAALVANVQVKTSQPNRSDVNSSSRTDIATKKIINIAAAVAVAECVVCKRNARPSSVYCSDDCIRRCAQHAINVITAKSEHTPTTPSIPHGLNVTLDEKKKKQKGLFEDLLAMPDRKPKTERIIVYDRKTGIKLSGSNAPTTITIKKWLHENPTYEIVLPGSQLSFEIERKQQQQRRPSSGQQKSVEEMERVRTTNATTTSPNLGIKENQTMLSSANLKAYSPPTVRTTKQIVDEHKQASRSSTPKQQQQHNQQQQQQKYSNQTPVKTARVEPGSTTAIKSKERLKRQNSEASSSGGGGGGGGSSSNSSKRKSMDTAVGPSPTLGSTSSPSSSEPIRMNVRRTLKNEILQRMSESSSTTSTSNGGELNRLTNDEVEAFVKQTESEMYNYFNRDTGQKYRNKYRSLMFNIKDRKNHTLFAKICAKQIEPKQLVHMSGAELASQELAKWREMENKHQLEMIKKSELEMLSCTKNYLFKNHKGEEVIETKETDVCVNLDITTPVEDLVNVLNSTTVGMQSFEKENAADGSGAGGVGAIEGSTPAKQTITTTGGGSMSPQTEQEHHHHSQHHHHDQQSASSRKRRDSERLRRSKSRERDNRHKDDTEKERERRERRHRSRSQDRQQHRDRHHRDKSRSSRRRSRSRSNSRSRSQERRYRNSSNRERERERERERDDKETKRPSQSADQKSSTKLTLSSQLQQKEKQRHSPNITKQKLSQKPQQQQQQPASMECFSLIDQIIESSKTIEEAANLYKESSNKDKSKVEKTKTDTAPTVPTSTSSASLSTSSSYANSAAVTTTTTSDSDQEPTSTVSIPTPPRDDAATFSRTNSPTSELNESSLWSGTISMIEVATLQINIQPLIGDSMHMGSILPPMLDIVGRIDNETVWEYLTKIRKSPNKEIVLVRLMPLSDDDIDGYAKLFSYLYQKKRLGVVKSLRPQIKDIYIYPLGNGKQMPKCLQILNEHAFYNDPYRADVIVGILVCVTGRKYEVPYKKETAGAIISTSTPHQVAAQFGSGSSSSKHNRRYHRADVAGSFTPPGSPKRRKRSHKNDFDLDAIVKAPVIRKPATLTTSSSATPTAEDDADEPYSPGGGSSDDELSSLYTTKAAASAPVHHHHLMGIKSADDELKRKMEEINRQIAAQEIEIAGLLNAETTGATASVLANISIPSNLPQILASINKSKEAPPTSAVPTQMSAMNSFEEYRPEGSLTVNAPVYKAKTTQPATATASTSRLAQLSEAELLSMVPDDVLMEPAIKPSTYYTEPPPPGV